jgi:hypothetical protein
MNIRFTIPFANQEWVVPKGATGTIQKSMFDPAAEVGKRWKFEVKTSGAWKDDGTVQYWAIINVPPDYVEAV